MKKSPSFREYPADAFSLTISDNSARLNFGLEEVPGDIESVEFICSIFLTHRSLKTIMLALNEVVGKYEDAVGEIQLDPNRIQQIKDAIAVSSKQNKKPPTRHG